MAVRNPPKKPCRGCPEPTAGFAPSTVKPPAPIARTGVEVRMKYSLPMEEGLRLWKHVVFGAGTCVAMIEGYAAFDMPGNPLEGLIHLRDRLNLVINHLENKSHAVPHPAEERTPPPSPPDVSPPLAG